MFRHNTTLFAYSVKKKFGPVFELTKSDERGQINAHSHKHKLGRKPINEINTHCIVVVFCALHQSEQCKQFWFLLLRHNFDNFMRIKLNPRNRNTVNVRMNMDLSVNVCVCGYWGALVLIIKVCGEYWNCAIKTHTFKPIKKLVQTLII